MHTLKGLGRTLGADELSRLAAEMEAGLRAGVPSSTLGQTLVALATTLDETMTYLRQAAHRLATPHPPRARVRAH